MHPLVALAGSYILAEAYERYVPEEVKAKWQNFVKTHHGEAGIAGLALGALTKSPSLAAAGLGLAYHDRVDAPKWFRSK